MQTRPHLLLVDDHQNIREPLAKYLRRYEFDVTTAEDGVAMRLLLQQRAFDLIVLDVMLPGEDGWSLCRFVHEHLQIPVVLLTAMNEPADRIVGLELGADDFVAKPFDPRELVARVRSVLRRSAITQGLARSQGKAPQAAPARDAMGYAFEGWVFDARGRRLRNPDGEEVALSAVEFQLLHVLLQNPNEVLSRNRLLDLTRRDGAEQVFDRSIDSQISRLRKKLQRDAGGAGFIRTARGDGYLFSAEVQARP
jgi:two-component system OmpR family response regulator